MKNYYEFSGSEYEIGVKIGSLFKDEIKVCTDAVRPYLDNPIVVDDFNHVKNSLVEKYPISLQHVYGRADGACVSRDEYLLYLCYEVYEESDRPDDHCTDVMIRVSDDEILLGHNEDGPYTSGNSAFIKYIMGDEYFYDFTYLDALAGGSFGWNNSGIVMTMNVEHMKCSDYNRRAMPIWFLLRELVSAKSGAQVIKMLEDVNVASGFHINVVDTNVHKGYSIEVIHDRVTVIELKEKYAHANHFIYPNSEYNFTFSERTSVFRQGMADMLLKNINASKAKIDDIRSILLFQGSTRFNSIFQSKEFPSNCTAATFLVNSKTKEIEIIGHLDNSVIFEKMA